MKTIRSFLPVENFIIKTDIPSNEISKILGNYAGDKYEGKIDNDRFCIHPIYTRFPNPYPILRGIIFQEENETLIKVHSRVNFGIHLFPVMLIFLITSLGFVTYLFTEPLSEIIKCIPLIALCSITWFLLLHIYWKDENEMKKILCRLLNGTIQNTTKSPR